MATERFVKTDNEKISNTSTFQRLSIVYSITPGHIWKEFGCKGRGLGHFGKSTGGIWLK